MLAASTIFTACAMQVNAPQYAVLRPKYLPTNGTTTMVNSSSNCCKLSRHSRSASESGWFSSAIVDSSSSEEGSDEISPAGEEEWVDGRM